MAELKLIWTPEPLEFPAGDEEALILSQEHETQVSATVTVEAPEDVTSPKSLAYSWPDAEPAHKQLSWKQSGKKLVLSILIHDWVGVFGKEINFMRDGSGVGIGQTRGAVDKWEAMPATTADVYAYRPDPVNVKRFRLVVGALDSKGDVIESAEYTITVYANYTIGRNALKEAVNTRRDAST